MLEMYQYDKITQSCDNGKVFDAIEYDVSDDQ
jgi:hypothetical protein